MDLFLLSFFFLLVFIQVDLPSCVFLFADHCCRERFGGLPGAQDKGALFHGGFAFASAEHKDTPIADHLTVRFLGSPRLCLSRVHTLLRPNLGPYLLRDFFPLTSLFLFVCVLVHLLFPCSVTAGRQGEFTFGLPFLLLGS